MKLLLSSLELLNNLVMNLAVMNLNKLFSFTMVLLVRSIAEVYREAGGNKGTGIDTVRREYGSDFHGLSTEQVRIILEAWKRDIQKGKVPTLVQGHMPAYGSKIDQDLYTMVMVRIEG
jgi:hypothetical protein